MRWFGRGADRREDSGPDVFVRCHHCHGLLFPPDLERNLKVCPKCDHHFWLTARERIDLLVDADSFQEYDAGLRTGNPLGFPEYESKVAKAQKESGLQEAMITGEATIGGRRVVLGAADPTFMMGSMGSVMGEKIARAFQRAVHKRLPVILTGGCGGGARMHESILSLMQMPKTSAAAGRLADAGLLYITILTDPVFGGVPASWAWLGDIVIAEPSTRVGFAGPRVIELSLKIKPSEEMHTAEFAYEHGMVDMLVHRRDLRNTLVRILTQAYAPDWDVGAQAEEAQPAGTPPTA
jgi:acetyl-CoA carboxylase carboxyl transferase subunit beta